jgi:hypothetical protein
LAIKTGHKTARQNTKWKRSALLHFQLGPERVEKSSSLEIAAITGFDCQKLLETKSREKPGFDEANSGLSNAN